MRAFQTIFQSLPKRLILVICLFGFSFAMFFQSSQSARVLNHPVSTKHFHHYHWNEVVSRSVSPTGAINFDRIKAYPKALNDYIDQIAAVSPDSHPQHFEDYGDRLAYWINAYHAIQMKLIMDVYPVDSTQQVPQLQGRKTYLVGGSPMSAHDIRQRVSAEFIGFPDVWFAMSDFTVKSPALMNRAYTGAKIKEVLAERVRLFLRDETRVLIKADSPPVQEGERIDVIDEEEAHCEKILLFPDNFREALPAIESYVILNQPEPDVSVLKGHHHLIDFLKESFTPLQYEVLSEACSVKVKYHKPDHRLNNISLQWAKKE